MNDQHTFEKSVLPGIKNIIVVASGKGGVGKSTVAAGLAMSLALEGYATGLFDADLYGPSIPIMFNLLNERPEAEDRGGETAIKPFDRFGIKLMSLGFFLDPSQAVIWRGPLVSNTLSQLINDTSWGELDYLIIDTPPGTGDIHITLLQQFELSGVVVVTTPQKMALSDVERAIGMYRTDSVGIPVLGVVENMAWFTPSQHPDEKYYLFGKGGGEALAAAFKIPLLAQIPINETICESCDGGTLSNLLSDAAIKKGFQLLVASIVNRDTSSTVQPHRQTTQNKFKILD